MQLLSFVFGRKPKEVPVVLSGPEKQALIELVKSADYAKGYMEYGPKLADYMMANGLNAAGFLGRYRAIQTSHGVSATAINEWVVNQVGNFLPQLSAEMHAACKKGEAFDPEKWIKERFDMIAYFAAAA